jgi:hypothetical protein
MASKVKEQKAKIKAKIEAVKRIADDGEKSFNEKSDKFLKDLPTTDALFGKKLSDFAEKRKKKKENNKDIFGELIDTVEGFLGTNNKIEINEKSTNKQRLRQHTNDSVHETLKSSKQIVMDSVKKVLFAGDGICGTNKSLINSVTISPSEFDFMNVLTVSPVSNSGKIVYEDNKERGLVKMNQLLYSGFTTGQTFTTKDGDPIFDFDWDSATQKYTFDNFSVTKVDEFLTTYYTNIEFLDISGVTKTAMLMTLQGDGTEPPLFDKGFNDLNRLLAKLCALCNNPTSTGTNQNPTTQFNENDEDIEFYFDFDNVEGIDLDDESARYKKVLRFKDCNNFESVADTSHYEDFVYLSNKKNLNDAVNNALLNAASAAHETSDSSIPPDNFHLSLLNTFILNLPKALIGSVLAPKYMLPIVIIYKSVVAGVGGLVESAKQIMKKLSKLFNEIIRNLLWKFLAEFWKRIKIDLLNFLQRLALKILKNKAKRYFVIISALIALLTKLLELGLDNCDTLFKLISQSIDLALRGGVAGLTGGVAQVPGFLLGLSHFLPGYSTDRALLNVTEKLESSGISTAPIFGESNNLTALVKSIIDGNTEEQDANSFIQVSTQEVIIPTPFGLPIIIPPGIITSSGKMF